MIRFVVYRFSALKIERVEFERETDKFFVNDTGRLTSKLSDYESYFETFQAAKDHIINRLKSKRESLSQELERTSEEIEKALELKEVAE